MKRALLTGIESGVRQPPHGQHASPPILAAGGGYTIGQSSRMQLSGSGFNRRRAILREAVLEP